MKEFNEQMEALRAWLMDTPHVNVEPADALDKVLRSANTTTSELESLWKELALRTKTPYVQKALA